MRSINTELQITNGIASPNKMSNLDYYYGTFNSLSEALTVVEPAIREKGRTVGIEFPIPNTNPVETQVVEYWFKSGTTDSHLVPKSMDLVSDTIAITEDNGSVRIEYTVTDDSIKQFYVNENYTGGGASFEGNGSILKPYKKLTYALKAIVGDNGTLVNPQYQNSEILIQSDLTVNQEDLNNTPVLQNRISVNKITIKSSSNEIRTIYYKGTTESPLNTAFLRSLDPYTFISLSLINIRINTETVKNIIYHKGDINNTFKTNNVVFVENFGSNSSSYQDVGKSLFGIPVLVQNTITKNGGVVMREGDGSLSSGTFNASNLFSIVSSSQTALRLKKTPIVFDALNLEINPWRIPVDSPSTLKPKPNLYRLHSEDSWVRISNLYDSGEVQSDVGGYDSFIYLENPNTILFGLGLIVDSGSIYHAEFNNVLRIAGNYTSEITINKFISRSVKSHTGDFLKISGDNITVNIESSKFHNVLSSTITRVIPYALNAIVNHSQFNTIPSYPDDATAKSIGRLIQGNIYLKNGVITRINS